MEDVTPPLIPDCQPWPLIQLLDNEREVIGMYLSGHPLDNYKFLLKYYKFDTIAEFNEFKAAINLYPNPARSFRIAGLVTEAQHRISKKGNKFGIMHLEDYSEKMELVFFGENYAKYTHYLEPGMVLSISGSFRQRYNTSPYEFQITNICLLESVMKAHTKRLNIELNPKDVSEDMIRFIESNVQKFPGNSALRFNICDDLSNLKFAMYSMDNTFEMNDEMANYLQQKPQYDIKVELT
jgi:DNA polymerase-3 subunit alpha